MPRQKTMRCEHHDGRRAKLYCWTCGVPICLQCGTTKHLPTSGHDCCDMEDSVDRCRSILQHRAAVVADQYANCLSRIVSTNDRIESTCREAEEQEMQIRRRGEELRIRLEQDLNRLIQDLETNKNSRIKELKKIGSELEEASVKLAGLSHQLNELSVNGTDVDVVEECGRTMSATRVDPLSVIPEPPHYVQPKFTSSALLQHANNLVGQLTVDHHETRHADDTGKQCKAGEWTCENCSLINQDTDIQCQICEHAPWKQDLKGLLVPVTHNHANAAGTHQIYPITA